MPPFHREESEAQRDGRIVLKRLFGDRVYSKMWRGLLSNRHWSLEDEAAETWGYGWNVWRRRRRGHGMKWRKQPRAGHREQRPGPGPWARSMRMAFPGF